MVQTVCWMDYPTALNIDPKLNPQSVMISISDADKEYHVGSEWEDRCLRLKFEDTDDKSKPNCFNQTHAEQVMNFLRILPDKEIDDVIVHCFAGISRSAAVARFIADVYNTPFNRNYALYNKLVYRTLMNYYQGYEDGHEL